MRESRERDSRFDRREVARPAADAQSAVREPRAVREPPCRTGISRGIVREPPARESRLVRESPAVREPPAARERPVVREPPVVREVRDARAHVPIGAPACDASKRGLPRPLAPAGTTTLAPMAHAVRTRRSKSPARTQIAPSDSSATDNLRKTERKRAGPRLIERLAGITERGTPGGPALFIQ